MSGSEIRKVSRAALLGALLWPCSALAGPPLPQSSEAPVGVGVAALYRLDLLPKLKAAVKIGCFSSYDRSGGNDDGFSGKYSFLRKESGGLVIAEIEGPGAIYRITTPSPTDDFIEFYFDGEALPRIRLRVREIYEGTHAPFLSPLVGNGVGGHYSYVPLLFQKSCKVLVKAEKFHFYQINYAQYPKGWVIPTYQNPPSQDFYQGLEGVRKIFNLTGSDITSYVAPPGAQLHTERTRITLKPGQSATLFQANAPGRIIGLRLGPASALAGKNRDIILKMYWDGDAEPAVTAPAGDFFGYSWGEPAIRSLLVGTAGDQNYSYFPMPFEKSARIELVWETKTRGSPEAPAADAEAIDIQAETTIPTRRGMLAKADSMPCGGVKTRLDQACPSPT